MRDLAKLVATAALAALLAYVLAMVVFARPERPWRDALDISNATIRALR